MIAGSPARRPERPSRCVIPAAESVSGVDQIAVAFEVSGTTALYDIELGKTIDGTGRGDACVIVFLRAPDAGRVKTRLARDIGTVAAAADRVLRLQHGQLRDA